VARRSLVAAADLRAGTVLTADHIAIRRPGNGLAPAMYSQVVGRRLLRDLGAGNLFTTEILG
jgi:sialic acid synthase SpsE